MTLHERDVKTSREVTKTVDISLTTVSHIIRMRNETGSVEPNQTGKCGRKKNTTRRNDTDLIRVRNKQMVRCLQLSSEAFALRYKCTKKIVSIKKISYHNV